MLKETERKKFVFSWFFDFALLVAAILCISIIVYNSIINQQLVDVVELILSLIFMLYSGVNLFLKKTDDYREKQVFSLEISHLIKDCNDVISNYLEIDNISLSKIEDKVINSFFDDWKKNKSIKSFEYNLVDSYINHLIQYLSLEEDFYLFIKYRIISSSLTVYFPKLVHEIENGDYFTNDSVHNKFIKRISLLGQEQKNQNLASLILSDKEIQETINYALKKTNPVIDQLIHEQKNKERIQFLLNKCYENAYSNIGNLDKELNDDEHRRLILLFKYDERFSILKRKWHTEIRKQLSTKFAKEDEISEEYQKAEKILDSLLTPQPFSKALSDFDYCIERIAPKEFFLHSIYPERFDSDAQGWSVEKFMKEKVLQRAKIHLNNFNKQLVKEFPYLKPFQKVSLDANFYIFYFNRKNFEYFADQESIPFVIKKFLIRSILESKNAGDHVTSQLVYMKQVIENLTISGLLFTENFETQNIVKENEIGIIRDSRRNNLIINNIHEIASMGNKIDVFTKSIYEVINETPLIRRAGKKFLFANNVALKIVENAKEILGLFETLKESNISPQQGNLMPDYSESVIE